LEPIFSPLSKTPKLKSEISDSEPAMETEIYTPRVTPQPRKLSGLSFDSLGWVSPVNVPISLPNSFHLHVKLEETPFEDREAADALIAMTSPSPKSSFEITLNQKRGQSMLSICTRQEGPPKKTRLSSPFSPSQRRSTSPQLSDSHSSFTSPVPSYSSISFDDFDSNSSDSHSFVTPLKRTICPSPYPRTPTACSVGGSGVTLDILADMAAGQLTSNVISCEINSMEAPSRDHNLSRIGEIVIHTLTNLRGEILPDDGNECQRQIKG
jgi:hypothetical protein